VATAEKSSAMETASFFEQRAALGSPHTAQAAWDKVGDKGALTDNRWTKKKAAQPFRNLRGLLLNF
jgi:hypothetical protein